MESDYFNPASLPPGTRIGPWRLLGQRSRGTYGVVYLAEHGDEPSGVVALKLALYPADARFAREAELLSRIRHPAVPRLLDHGQLQSRSGASHAWLAMEWVEGLSLYDWALAQRPSSRQVLLLLARLARALEATRAAGGIHRDVKGENVRVRSEDGQPFLLDFGAGHYLGAATLTWPPFPPSTPTYRSPEAWRFVPRSGKPPAIAYAPGPADDVFALGVTAYRLVTGKYPPSTHPDAEDVWLWRPKELRSWTARACNALCTPELSALVSRMLSTRPEARGTAQELAEALEYSARKAGSEADAPLFTGEEPRPAGLFPPPQRVTVQRPPRLPRWPWLAAGSLAGALALSAAGLLSVRVPEHPSAPHLAEEDRDAGTIAVGDSSLTAPVAPNRAPAMWSALSVDIPPKPFPGQLRPDAKGRCPGKGLITINGGCWSKLPVELKDCDNEASFTYKGACYAPVLSPPRPSTSEPTNRANSPQ